MYTSASNTATQNPPKFNPNNEINSREKKSKAILFPLSHISCMWVTEHRVSVSCSKRNLIKSNRSKNWNWSFLSNILGGCLFFVFGGYCCVCAFHHMLHITYEQTDSLEESLYHTTTINCLLFS